jgi:O-antigen ligase
MIWVLVGYMWLFIHRPFEVWPILGAIHIERVYMIFTLAAWAAVSEKQLNENKIHAAVAFCFFAMVVCSILSPTAGIAGFISGDYWKYTVFYFLMTSSVKTEKDLKILTVGYLVSFFLYMAHCYREFLCGRGYFAMGIFRMIGIDSTNGDPNHLSNTIVCTLPFLFPVLLICTKKWHYLWIISLIVLCLRSVQCTGSRTGLTIFVLGVITAAALSKYRVRLFVILACLAPAVWFVMDESQQTRIISLIDPSVGPSNAQASADSRWYFFEDCMRLWGENPLFGVGPGQVQVVGTYHMQPHTLYGQIPAELGLLGVIAWGTLTVFFLINHLQAMQMYKELGKLGRAKEGQFCYYLSYAVVFAIYMMYAFGFGVHNGYRYNWIWWAGFQSIAVSMLQEKLNLAYRDRTIELASNNPPKPLKELPATK